MHVDGWCFLRSQEDLCSFLDPNSGGFLQLALASFCLQFLGCHRYSIVTRTWPPAQAGFFSRYQSCSVRSTTSTGGRRSRSAGAVPVEPAVGRSSKSLGGARNGYRSGYSAVSD